MRAPWTPRKSKSSKNVVGPPTTVEVENLKALAPQKPVRKVGLDPDEESLKFADLLEYEDMHLKDQRAYYEGSQSSRTANTTKDSKEPAHSAGLLMIGGGSDPSITHYDRERSEVPPLRRTLSGDGFTPEDKDGALWNALTSPNPSNNNNSTRGGRKKRVSVSVIRTTSSKPQLSNLSKQMLSEKPAKQQGSGTSNGKRTSKLGSSLSAIQAPRKSATTTRPRSSSTSNQGSTQGSSQSSSNHNRKIKYLDDSSHHHHNGMSKSSRSHKVRRSSSRDSFIMLTGSESSRRLMGSSSERRTASTTASRQRVVEFEPALDLGGDSKKFQDGGDAEEEDPLLDELSISMESQPRSSRKASTGRASAGSTKPSPSPPAELQHTSKAQDCKDGDKDCCCSGCPKGNNPDWTCKCGFSMEGSFKFCGQCGTPKHWTCRECQSSRNISSFAFCGDCGAKRSSTKRKKSRKYSSTQQVEMPKTVDVEGQ